jgi:hypothetical protein
VCIYIDIDICFNNFRQTTTECSSVGSRERNRGKAGREEKEEDGSAASEEEDEEEDEEEEHGGGCHERDGRLWKRCSMLELKEEQLMREYEGRLRDVEARINAVYCQRTGACVCVCGQTEGCVCGQTEGGVCVWTERERERARERVCVCVCVGGWVGEKRRALRHAYALVCEEHAL